MAQLIQAKAQEWRVLEEWCRKIGYSPEDLKIRLAAVRVERRLQEDALEATSPENRRHKAKFVRAVEQAQPLLRRLDRILNAGRKRSAPDSPEDLVSLISRIISEYLADLEGPDPSLRMPRHRPRDRWVKPHVLAFAHRFQMRGVSINQTYTQIARIFEFAGHGDLVTTHVVRNILRKTRTWRVSESSKQRQE